ncbi:hypothetical protein PILCRDRAFT_128389 [Piloderma croceum F 1598]|uniref:Uncharacterized protein n=1 Tax=Piloderma croceum (strain F 1598) TaxID=765440 RepID=A0A0C3GIB9_PILCF|nr:hypothetical protein PILCRDRAFT_128389 [Piloderma croceum F 1598]
MWLQVINIADAEKACEPTRHPSRLNDIALCEGIERRVNQANRRHPIWTPAMNCFLLLCLLAIANVSGTQLT